MKVALVTLHYVRNQGSLLQTLATQTIIEKLGYECEVINYIPIGLTVSRCVATIRSTGNLVFNLLRKIGAWFIFSIQQLMVKRFLHQYVHLTSKTYHQFKDLVKNPPQADIFLSGSDQIWNTQNANEPDDVRGYYLDFVKHPIRKIAYASSIGKDTFNNDEVIMVRHLLSDYDAISVREKQAVELLASIGINNAVHVLDPTLLVTSQEWKQFAGEQKINEPYIFVYNLNRNPLIKQYAIALAKDKSLRIVNFADTLDFIKGAKNLFFNTPKDFIKYIDNAKYVLTDSFHGTAFCINFKKQFLTFPAPRFNSRIDSLLTLFGLEERKYNNQLLDLSLIKKIINFDEVKTKLDVERNRSRKFLINSLSIN